MHEMGLLAGMSIIWTANVNGQSIHPPIGTTLPDPQQVVTSIELKAINDPATGKGALPLDLIMDCTDPIIRGVSVLHCHLLKHEDKGMMAKILF